MKAIGWSLPEPNDFRELIGRFWYFDVSKMPGVWNFAFRRFSNTKQAAPNKAWTLRCSLGGIQTLNTSINSTQIPFEKLFRHPPDNIRHYQTPTDTKKHQQTLPDTQKGVSRMCGGLCWHQMWVRFRSWKSAFFGTFFSTFYSAFTTNSAF